MNATKPPPGKAWTGIVHRTVPEAQWVAACEKVSRDLIGVDLHWYCSSDEGDPLVCKLVGTHLNAIHYYFWSLISDDG